MKSIKSFPTYTQGGIAYKPIIQVLDALSANALVLLSKMPIIRIQFGEIERVICMTKRITNEGNIITNIVENIVNQAI